MPEENAEPVTVYLGLGANLGERAAAIAEAIRRLGGSGALTDVVASPLYETDAVTGEPQPAFLNAVVRGRTRLAAEALLARCLEIEAALGRVRPPGPREAPRTIDIDVLLFGDAVIRTAALTVPHPRMLDRAFVLVPLADVAETGLRHPTAGVTLDTALPSSGVRKVTRQIDPWGQ